MPDDKYYSYLFHWNPFTKKWNCFPREGIRDYFNGVKKFGVGNTVDQAYKDLTHTHIPKDEINCC